MLAAAFVLGSNTMGMNRVRQETRTDEAVLKQKVSGQGVTIAILDRGIDWRHPDFITPKGTTRIKWLLDITGQRFCDVNDPAAAEYSEAQINTALFGGDPIHHRDAAGHGTVMAGLAAGNGRAGAGDKYRGMAPEADLIIVKVTSEGAIVHDGQPAEAPFQGCIDDALDWLDDKMTQMGQPAVALINSGVQWGPMDGISAVIRKIDQVFGLDRPDRVYASPSGDSGGGPNHAGGDDDNQNGVTVRLSNTSEETAYMKTWYTGDMPTEITIGFDEVQRLVSLDRVALPSFNTDQAKRSIRGSPQAKTAASGFAP